MINLLKKYFGNIYFDSLGRKNSLDEAVDRSVKKYYDTYKLLEAYDKKSKKEAGVLADSEGLREYFQPFL